MTKSCTSTLRFSFPFSTSLLEDVTIVVKDYKSPTMYTVRGKLNECAIEENSIMFTISSREMSNFGEHNKLKIQLIAYFTNGTKRASKVFYRTIEEIIDEEVV